METRLGRLHRTRLHQKDAGDDLQAVGHPVLQFLEQHPLLSQQLFLFALEDALPGNIRDAEQNGRIEPALVENLAGVQEHRALSEVGELMLTS